MRRSLKVNEFLFALEGLAWPSIKCLSLSETNVQLRRFLLLPSRLSYKVVLNTDTPATYLCHSNLLIGQIQIWALFYEEWITLSSG